ncbi:MAG: hypothetical protein M1814_003626 [Vezdaea aestivalis]|nr:MAG: hypothetical protein M1814_003626 [Vezdaea aestivalis]
MANMFKTFASRDRAGKATRSHSRKTSVRDHSKYRLAEAEHHSTVSPPIGTTLTSPIVTLVVGPDQRLFAAHEDVLSLSPFFATVLRGHFMESHARRVTLPEDDPVAFSAILEYLYKGDYYPRLLHDKRRNTWELEDADSGDHKTRGREVESTLYLPSVGDSILKDTVVYCYASKYGLDELQRLSLRKQGLHTGIEVGTILRSARYAYDNTPDNDSKLRAHYLALIIRCRDTFKRSGTMQQEMMEGGKMFFDLFVSMVNHIDDIVSLTNKSSPKTI